MKFLQIQQIAAINLSACVADVDKRNKNACWILVANTRGYSLTRGVVKTERTDRFGKGESNGFDIHGSGM